MTRKNLPDSYCGAARALEVLGEKWALLLVRDLLNGPRRFSDLLRSVGGPTPKVLTLRLRELEAAGIVERDDAPGRREVWYRLTPAGLALRPVMRELVIWGVEHGRPPEPDEPVDPRRLGSGSIAVLNRLGIRPDAPVTWRLRVGDQPYPVLQFDGGTWSDAPPGAPVDLDIDATTDTWISWLRTDRDHDALHDRIELLGDPTQVARFERAFAQERVLAGKE
jgi:DNA-binding HxlR family transcriptional regulator